MKLIKKTNNTLFNMFIVLMILEITGIISIGLHKVLYPILISLVLSTIYIIIKSITIFFKKEKEKK